MTYRNTSMTYHQGGGEEPHSSHHTKPVQSISLWESWDMCTPNHDMTSKFLHLQWFRFLGLRRISQGSKHPIHPNGVVTIVVSIRGMMDGMITCSHYRPHISMKTIMDIRCPYRLYKQRKLMGEEMGGHYKDEYHMWTSLQYPINWIKRQSYKEIKKK